MKLVKLLAVAAVLAVAGSAFAAEAAAEAPKKPTRTKGLRGKIVKVEDGKITVKTTARGTVESKEVIVATDDKTVVTIDKKEAKVADLKVDMYVHVTPAEGTATKISAMTKAPEPRKPKADQPKPAE